MLRGRCYESCLAHRNRSDFCDLRLRCPSQTPEIVRFPRKEKAMLHCDLRVRWKVASDLRFRAAISEPKTPSFCRISCDSAQSTRKSLAEYRSSQNYYRQSCHSGAYISPKLPLPLPSWNSDELIEVPLPLPSCVLASWRLQWPLHVHWFPITILKVIWINFPHITVTVTVLKCFWIRKVAILNVTVVVCFWTALSWDQSQKQLRSSLLTWDNWQEHFPLPKADALSNTSLKCCLYSGVKQWASGRHCHSGGSNRPLTPIFFLEKHRDAPHISIAMLLQKYALHQARIKNSHKSALQNLGINRCCSAPIFHTKSPKLNDIFGIFNGFPPDCHGLLIPFLWFSANFLIASASYRVEKTPKPTNRRE